MNTEKESQNQTALADGNELTDNELESIVAATGAGAKAPNGPRGVSPVYKTLGPIDPKHIYVFGGGPAHLRIGV